MKQAIMEKFFHEIPYQVGIQVVGWVPKVNGELRIDFRLDVRNRVQQGMLLGARGRIIKEVRERCQQLLMQRLQRPVVCVLQVSQRKNTIEAQNVYIICAATDSFHDGFLEDWLQAPHLDLAVECDHKE